MRVWAFGVPRLLGLAITLRSAISIYGIHRVCIEVMERNMVTTI